MLKLAVEISNISPFGWLQPLLDVIARDSTHVVSPSIANICDRTFAVRFGIGKRGKRSKLHVGGFNWDLENPFPKYNQFQNWWLQLEAPSWLEPLLDRIKRLKQVIASPQIDIIDDNTLEVMFHEIPSHCGGFDWDMNFNWHAIPERERKRHKNAAEPVWTPTMAGGLFSIDKAFFEKLGTYDSGFDIWGGENLELSFKTWMCGGTLEIVPCSHVGHIFRKRSPYKWRTGVNVLKRNSVRLAEVWMDEYKNYYYQRIGHDLGDFGDVTSRKELRRNLGCKSFKWYLDNIYPELFIPGDAVASGDVSNDWSGMCIDSACKPTDMHKPVGLYPCHKQGGNQFWMMSKHGEIRRDEACLDYAGGDVILYPCHGSKGNQYFEYDYKNKRLKHGVSKQCLAISKDKKKLQVKQCDPNDDTQNWNWDEYSPDKLPKNYDNERRLIFHGTSKKCLAISTNKLKLTMQDCDEERSNQRWDFENYEADKISLLSDLL
ncbi:hypothetical protein M8J77_012507 [Diaphorina citri]|nr:hypothetical protein M8J77_012507 [Diaphorina citri]